jgi:hypothetical protein
MSLLWILIASLLSFSVAAIFAGLLKLQRNIYLLIYIPFVIVLFAWYIISNDIIIRDLILHNWYWGLPGALLAGAFVIRNVYSQPPSKRNTGLGLVTDITWSGLTYGLMDALLLSVLPILAVKLAFSDSGWSEIWYGKIGIAAIALLASFFITTAYHLGYPEFRNKNIIYPNVGNGILSLAYILTMNPLAAVLPHMAMHVAAMLHGRETTGQVPPHYNDSSMVS